MLYNICGSSKDWDEQILGHLHTIDVDPSQLPYEQRKALFDEMEDAVLGNVYGTVAYEKKYLTPKEAA